MASLDVRRLSDPVQTERLLFDPGELSLWLKLPMTFLGLLGIWGGFHVAHDSIIAAALAGIFGIAFLAVWFPRAQGRIFYDDSKKQLICRGILGSSTRLSLSGAEAMYVEDGRSMISSFSEIYIRYPEGRDRCILRVPPGDPGHLAVTISDAIGLPIIQI